MEILERFLFYIGGYIIGIIVGVLIHRRITIRKKTAGLLKVVSDKNEKPYIFLEITKPEILETLGDYIYLKVDQVKYEDFVK